MDSLHQLGFHGVQLPPELNEMSLRHAVKNSVRCILGETEAENCSQLKTVCMLTISLSGGREGCCNQPLSDLPSCIYENDSKTFAVKKVGGWGWCWWWWRWRWGAWGVATAARPEREGMTSW